MMKLENRLRSLEEKTKYIQKTVELQSDPSDYLAEIAKESPEYISQLIEKFETTKPAIDSVFSEEIHEANILSLKVLL